MCHYPDKADTKAGPGLKGLFQKDQMSVSGWEVTDDNIRKQLKTPFDKMPAFPDQTEQEIQAIIAYLRSL
jgi:cytochrome c2